MPTIGDLVITRIDNGVPADWGVYVQGYSKAKIQITGAAGTYGSTIRSYSINSSGFSASGQEATAGPITQSGTVDFWGTVIDSRMRSAVLTKSIQVEPYSRPFFTSTPAVIRSNASGAEDTNGEYIAITAAWDYSLKDKNTCAGAYRITLVSGSASELTGTLTNGTQTVVPASSDYSWTVSITLTDALSSSPYTATVPTGSTLMDFRSGGKGIAIGKVAETDGFDVDMDTRFRRAVNMQGNLSASNVSMTGTVNITGSLSIPTKGAILKTTAGGLTTGAVSGTDYTPGTPTSTTITLTFSDGTTVTLKAYKFGRLVMFPESVWVDKGNVTEGKVGTIPTGYRPTANFTLCPPSNLGYGGYIQFRTNGDIYIGQLMGGVRFAGFICNINYVVP